jgi:hypothetical protein
MTREEFVAQVVSQHWSSSVRETYTESDGDDPLLLHDWLMDHPDAILVYSRNLIPVHQGWH